MCCHVDGWGSVAPLQNKEHIPVLGKGGGRQDEIEIAALNVPDSVHHAAFVLQRQATDRYTHRQATQRAEESPACISIIPTAVTAWSQRYSWVLVSAICILTKLHGCERSGYKATTPRFCHAASHLINLNHKVSVQLDKHSSAIDGDLNSCWGSAGESHGFELESLSWISSEMEFSLSQGRGVTSITHLPQLGSEVGRSSRRRGPDRLSWGKQLLSASKLF